VTYCSTSVQATCYRSTIHWYCHATRDEVWIGNWIYWTLTLVTTNNYDSFAELHFQDHCKYSTHKVFSDFIIRCLIAASNGRLFPSSGFPNCLLTQLFTSPSSYSPGTDRRKNIFSVLACFAVAGGMTCPATAVVLSPVYTAVIWHNNVAWNCAI
jgi:hypothetical protein